MIHVCFPLHDRYGDYSKYEGIAIASLFSATKEAVAVHIIHDGTLTPENRKKFETLADEHHQEIMFYEIPADEFRAYEAMTRLYSIGTLFRLLIPEILPSDIQKVIYLDADIVVNMDIAKLWGFDVEGKALAAVPDQELQRPKLTFQPWPCKAGMVSVHDYFNGGVMVLNLKKIRAEHQLKKECLAFLSSHPDCTFADQDAMNVIFKDEYQKLPPYCNLFTKFLDDTTQPEGILHFAGVNENFECPHWAEERFLEIWSKSPWASDMGQYFSAITKHHGKQLLAYQTLLRHRSKGGKIIFWGTRGAVYRAVKEILPPDSRTDYFVDNQPEMQSQLVDGVSVYAPSQIYEEKGCCIVMVLARRAYSEIREELVNAGFQEDIDFFDGRMLLMQDQSQGII